MRYLAGAVALVFALAACSADDSRTGPQTILDPVTGLNAFVSGEYKAAPTLSTRAAYVADLGHVVLVDYRASSWAFINQAHSGGRKLEYIKMDQRVISCVNGCKILESGSIRLPSSEFQEYSKTGMKLALTGSRGRVDGYIPAKAFQEVIEMGKN